MCWSCKCCPLCFLLCETGWAAGKLTTSTSTLITCHWIKIGFPFSGIVEAWPNWGYSPFHQRCFEGSNKLLPMFGPLSWIQGSEHYLLSFLRSRAKKNCWISWYVLYVIPSPERYRSRYNIREFLRHQILPRYFFRRCFLRPFSPLVSSPFAIFALGRWSEDAELRKCLPHAAASSFGSFRRCDWFPSYGRTL